jgi:Alpha/beta hydrolase
MNSNSSTSSCRPDDMTSLAEVYESIAQQLSVRALHLFSSKLTATVGMRAQRHVDRHHYRSSMLRSVAVAFVRADLAAREYTTRIHRVDESIADWLPSNRDRARESVARIGENNMLTFDPSKDGRVVEALGPVQTANHVAVLVPGMDNDITDYAGLRKRAENLRAAMQKLAAPGETVAVVMWLGYDTPDLTMPRLVTEGARSEKANSGAKALDADIDFLRRVNARAHLTVIGHSYGTVVVGQALKQGLDVDDAVVLGSPGMDVRDRTELKSPTVKLWATRHRKKDYIPLLPVHGEDPAAPGFHAERFRSDGLKNHSDYFRSDSLALKNIALIAIGGEPTR